MKWKVAFIADIEDLDGEGTMGFKLGPSDYELKLSEVFPLTNVGTTYFFMSFNASRSQALTAYSWDEFRGIGQTITDCYKDVLARVAAGIGNGTLNEAKYMIRAFWYSGGEWHNGNIHDFETAGSPEPVYFTNLIDLFGVE